MTTNLKQIAAGLAMTAIVGVAMLGNAGHALANGLGDGIVGPPTAVLTQDPPQTGYADLTVKVSGFRPFGGPVITISNIGTRDAWPFPVQEFSNGQSYNTQIPGLAAGTSMTFTDHLAPADCGHEVTILIDNPKSMPELSYGNNEVRFTPTCFNLSELQAVSVDSSR
jgi:CARDB protein